MAVAACICLLGVGAVLLGWRIRQIVALHGPLPDPPPAPPEPPPFDIRALSLNSRMAHQIVIAGSDHGKTSLLEYQIHNDLIADQRAASPIQRDV